MKRHILGIALAAACAAASAQTQSGSGIGSESGSGGRASANTPAPLPPSPSTGPNSDSAVSQSTPPRAPQTSPETRSSGRCDNLNEKERAQCLREQASTGTAGAGSTGASPGGSR